MFQLRQQLHLPQRRRLPAAPGRHELGRKVALPVLLRQPLHVGEGTSEGEEGKNQQKTKHNINLCNSSQAKTCIKLEGLKYYSLLTHSSLCYLLCRSQGSTHSTTDYYQYTEPLFMKYHFMKFKDLVYYKRMQIMNRSGSNILPVSLKNIFFCSIQGKKVNKEDLLKDFVSLICFIIAYFI